MIINNTVLVIGAGASGMMAAISAAENGSKVIILEKNSKVGRKLLITGKGRCNITNNCDVQTFISSVLTNGKFLYSAVNTFKPEDTIDFLEKNGVKTKTERGNRVFPESDKAVDVVDMFYRLLKKSNCKVINKRADRIIVENGSIKGAITGDGTSIYADSVIIACGGMSYPLTGSTGDGYKLAKSVGHSITAIKPSLVPLEAFDNLCKKLQGLSLKNIAVKVINNMDKNLVYEDFGELLFTHFGLSGPVILSASSHMRDINKNSYTVFIDLKPALSFEQLDARVQRDLKENANKNFDNSLSKLLPQKLIPVIINISEINPKIKCNQITKEERYKLIKILKNLEVKISGFRPIEEAIITSGGVSTLEIDPKTMESKKIKGLYFAGEVIDVDAYTGGFNLQIAFSTGYLSGISASRN